MDGGFNAGYSYAYPTLDSMSQGQYAAPQQQQQPTGAYQFGGGFTPMISDTNQGTGSTYQPAPSYTTYNMPTTNTNTSTYSPTFGGYSPTSTLTLPQMPAAQYPSAPQPQASQQPAAPTTAFTDAQGRPITYVNGQWVSQVNSPSGRPTNLQYQGFAVPTNPYTQR